MRTRVIIFMSLVMAVCVHVGIQPASAQAPVEAPAAGIEAAGDDAVPPGREGMGFSDVIRQSGILGMALWLALLSISVAGVWLVIDSFMTIQRKKIVPKALVDQVRKAMEHGDLVKALDRCEASPGPLSNILSAGFSNVEEGYDVVQDAIAVAADLESEKLLQRVAYLNLVGNLSPMLGLLGTVQGMIYAFQNLGIGAGGSGSSLLALNISQALFTTAAGLVIAVPAVGFYYLFRNRATNIILTMEGLTLDLIKVLRNVEIVEEGA